MWSKLIVVVVLAFSVANASVIINVFDEDPEILGSKSLHFGDCNYQECDQRCRNLGFTGGACVNGRCKCDINRKEVPEIRQVISELAKSAYPLDCNPQACDQQCRNIGFTGGVCVHERCKCDINRKEIPDMYKKFAELAKSLYPRDCNELTCDQTCQRFGYPSGYCVDGNCECINRKKDALLVKDGSNFEKKKRKEGKPSFNLPRACDIFNCNDMCQRLNYVGGMCDMDSTCQCF